MRRALLAAAALTVLAAGGCDAPRPRERAEAAATGSPLDCFPAAARPWIPFAARTASPVAPGAAPATLYVDGSGSMAGYLRGATPRARPLQDLVSADLLAGALRTPVTFKRFGERLHDVPAEEAPRLAEPAGYGCASGGDCDNAETRLDVVFAAIAASPKAAVSLVVTDLWLSNPNSRTSGVVDMAAPLQRIFESGRSVAVYGIAAPYAGRLYDLPSGRSDVTAARRPLFLVAVGPDARLRALDEGLRASPSELIAAGLADGRVRRALFTRAPGAEGGGGTLSPPGGGVLTTAPVLAAREGVRMTQIAVSRRAAREAASGRGPPATRAPPTWSGPDAKRFAPGAVWTGPLEPQLAAYELRGETCAADRDWRDYGRLSGGWSSDAAGRWRFALTPSLLGDLRPGRYLLVGTLVRTGLDTPNPADDWMRDWSLAPGAPERPAADGVFPTLNLAETARVLETALAADARTRPVAVDGWTAAVKVGE